MLELLDVRFSFFCRSTHSDKDGNHPIILRISFRGGRRDLFTGIYCSKIDWDSNTTTVLKTDKEAAAKNRNLEIMLPKTNNVFDSFRFSGEEFSLDELVSKLKGKEEEPELLIEYLQKGNMAVKKRVGVEITQATYNKYDVSLRYMHEFLLNHYKVKNYTLKKLNLKFFEDYFHFLRAEKSISHNVARKYIEFVKTIIYPAVRNGVIQNDPFRELKFKAKPVIREFLSQEEIEKLIALETNDPDLERKRDIFIFACFTGLAYIDIKGFKAQHLTQDNDGTWFIRKPRQKTGEESIIPLLLVAVIFISALNFFH